MVQCRNFKIRQKHYNKFIWCNFYKKVITYEDCKNCLNRNLVRNKPIKKVGNKKISVKKEIYQKVYERDNGICRLCGKQNIELHHIRYRSERKDLINDEKNCIMLCTECHQKVHSNKHYWQPILLEMVKENYE